MNKNVTTVMTNIFMTLNCDSYWIIPSQRSIHYKLVLVSFTLIYVLIPATIVFSSVKHGTASRINWELAEVLRKHNLHGNRRH